MPSSGPRMRRLERLPVPQAASSIWLKNFSPLTRGL
jgi:hypothetical protein